MLQNSQPAPVSLSFQNWHEQFDLQLATILRWLKWLCGCNPLVATQKLHMFGYGEVTHVRILDQKQSLTHVCMHCSMFVSAGLVVKVLRFSPMRLLTVYEALQGQSRV